MSSPPFILTCPSSRGIGHALTRLILSRTTCPVVATARADLQGVKRSILQGLDVDEKRLEVLKVDVANENTISAAAAKVKELHPNHHLRLAFIFPGIMHPEKSLKDVEYENAVETYKVNTLGPLFLMKYFSPFLPNRRSVLPLFPGRPNHAVWAMMSARVGSISDNTTGGWYTYRSSKSALNQLTKTFDINLQRTSGSNAMAVALHPGTVKTDLSKEFWESAKKGRGLKEVDEAVESLWDVVSGLKMEQRGRVWDWKGEEIMP